MHQSSVPAAIFSAPAEFLAKECDEVAFQAFWRDWVFATLGYRL
jgi:hypothetical protein